MKRYAIPSAILACAMLCSAGVVFANDSGEHSDEHHENSHDRHERHVARPTFSKTSDITVQSSGNPEGTKVYFDTPSATDRTDGSLTVTCDHASGDLYPDGRTTVICTSAVNTHGLAAQTHFRIWVKGSTDQNIIITFTSFSTTTSDVFIVTANPSVVVTYTVSATEHDTTPIDRDDTLTCTPASPSTYYVDTTTPIICNLTDGHGHRLYQDSASVTVVPADVSVCTPASVSNGSVAPFPGCAITCNSNYTLSGSSCAPASNGSPGLGVASVGSGAGGRNSAGGVIHALFPGWDWGVLGSARPNNSPPPSGGKQGGGSGSSNGGTSFAFTVPLSGTGAPTGGGGSSQAVAQAEILNLQLFLNAHGFLVAKTGPGSPGHETTAFGPATKAALKKFQEANAKDILAPFGLKKGTGTLGAATINFINKLLGLSGNVLVNQHPSTGTQAPKPQKPANKQSTKKDTVSQVGAANAALNPPAPKKFSCPSWLCFWRRN